MPFDVLAFLSSPGGPKIIGEYGRNETIFTPGDACKTVLYIRRGGVRLTVRSKSGREAEVATLGPGEFFGEACLAGQRFRRASATAITPTTIQSITKAAMTRLLRRHRGMADRFIAHLLYRNILGEEDLVAELVQRSERIGSSLAARRAGR
jgi:CRP/FNR family transcriptional regulator, cyclic AMP receptor protein